MVKNKKNKKPIEVDFYDVTDSNQNWTSEQNQFQGTEEIIKPKKLSLRLLSRFLQTKAKSIIGNKEKTVELVTKALSFCKKLGNISFVKKWVLDIPKLCDMLSDTINGVYKNAPYSSLVMVAIAIIYAVSPFDLLHDAIPFLGILDDVAILKAVLNTIKNDLDSYTSWKDIQEAS